MAEAEREAVQCMTGLRLRATERLSDLLDSPAPVVALRAIDLVLVQAKARTGVTTSQCESPEWERIIKRISNGEAKAT